MNRREALFTTGSMVVSASLGALACGGNNAGAQAQATRPVAPPVTGGGGNAAAAAAVHDAAQNCLQKGSSCVSHCLAMFAAGDTSMGACGKASYEMHQVMIGLAAAAAAQSKNLSALAKAAIEFCKDCETECKKHADHHVICKECMEACSKTIAACSKLA